MITLYCGSGSTEIDLLDEEGRVNPRWEEKKALAAKLLRQRGQSSAAAFLEENPFVLRVGTNSFNDDFHVLYLHAAMERYVELEALDNDSTTSTDCQHIAAALQEVTNAYVRFVAVGLDTSAGTLQVQTPTLRYTSELVERALGDAEQLIRTQGATSGVDRVHTALHGYLRELASAAGLTFDQGAGITELFKLVKAQHPDFQQAQQRQPELDKILRALANIVDALNPVRNHTSLAHANDRLLEEPEAMLVVNAVRTLLHYLNARTHL